MAKTWYVRQVPEAEPSGPYDVGELRELVRSGGYRLAVVAQNGEAEWRPLLVALAELDPLGNASTAVHQTMTPTPQRRSAPSYSSYPPPAPQMSPLSVPPPAVRLSNATIIGLALGGAVIVAALLFTVVVLVRRHGGGDASKAVVRVVLPRGSGTGFFVAGPDKLAYVATAYHVVASGEPVLIELTQGGDQGHYVEAFPDAEVVAFDADADLAVVRLNGVTADKFSVLPLALSAVADQAVLSYGFPGSSLVSSSGMVNKPGKVLSVVKFPVIDHRTGEVVRSDATPGLLVSVDIEPGFSGGPTLNDKGEVIGVNVTKDLAHRGQNGAVDVSVLRELLSHVKAAADDKGPTPDAVKELLAKIEREYLLLPLERRKTAREDDFVSMGDLPRVGELITTIRRLENDTSRRPDTKVSGAAGLGLVLARLPGRPLETYSDRSTKKAMADCEVRERGLREFFGSLAAARGVGAPPQGAADEVLDKCSELAFRPIVWDLTAMALQWSGQPRDITVSKVDVVDEHRHFYRAQVRFGGIDHLVDVWLGGDGGRLRLKLFDNEGEATGLSAAKEVPGSAFAGTWHRSDARISHNLTPQTQTDMDTEESLAVTVTGDGAATVTHQYRRHYYRTGKSRIPCGNGSDLSLGLEQTFNGTVESGTLTAGRTKDTHPIGSDMAHCGEALSYAPDLIVVLKLVGDKLLEYRTGGAEYPEVVEFTRQL